MKQGKTGEKPSKSSKSSDHEKINLTRVLRGEVNGHISEYVLGYTEEEYLGRKVVLVRKEPGMFGCEGIARERESKMTLVNGIINSCDIRETPTPYWAVLDAASELRSGFSNDDVVDLAMKRFPNGSRPACVNAWQVLKTHQSHPTKKHSGMAHMIDDGEMVDGRRTFCVRGRSVDETPFFFESQKRRTKRMAKARKRGLDSVEEPTEEHPLSVVYSNPR